MGVVEHLRSGIELLPALAKFGIGMVLIIVVPKLALRIRLPEAVGLLLSGVVVGPYVLDVFPREHPVAQIFAELGMLLLMFFAGLGINLGLFRQQIHRSIAFGVAKLGLRNSEPFVVTVGATMMSDILSLLVSSGIGWSDRHHAPSHRIRAG